MDKLDLTQKEGKMRTRFWKIVKNIDLQNLFWNHKLLEYCILDLRML